MPVETTPVRFRILGTLEVSCGDELVTPAGALHRRVLVMLLLEVNRVVPMDRLVAAAWDDEPPATAFRQVRKIVAHLRQRLPGGQDLIRTQEPGYRIVLADGQLDLSRFTSYLADAREREAAGEIGTAVIALRAAIAEYRGPVLVGDGGKVIDAAGALLDERRLTAVEHLADLRLALGEAAGVVAELRELTRAHPMRESARGLLMLALYRSGRQAEALTEYERLRRLLADELGIDPGRALATLHERILRGSAELDGPAPPHAEPVGPAVLGSPPRFLPRDLPDFSGRDTELGQLMAAAEGSEGGIGMVAVDGVGGSGKTTLVVHAAHLLAARYPDGQIFVDLHGFTPGRRPVEPVEALGILLGALGVSVDGQPDDLVGRVSLWRTVAATRRLLVVLDNAVDSAQVIPLLPGMCCCLVLITSRARLTGLDGVRPVALDLLDEPAALALLDAVLGTDRTAAEPEATRRLVHACGRLPLALRIAAARLHTRPQWSISHLVDRLTGPGARLAELVAEDRSVAATIGLSYEVMKPDGQELFQVLGRLGGCEFDVYAAGVLAGRSRDEVEPLLEELVDARLLEPAGVGRYTFHDLVRDYAASTVRSGLSDPGLRAACHRLLGHYRCLARAARELIRSGGPGQVRSPLLPDAEAALTWFATELGNLRAVIRHAHLAGLTQQAEELQQVVDWYLRRGKPLLEWENSPFSVKSAVSTPVDGTRQVSGLTMER